MLTKNIGFKNFQIKKKNKLIKNTLKLILNENNQIIQSLKASYKNTYDVEEAQLAGDLLQTGRNVAYDAFKKIVIS